MYRLLQYGRVTSALRGSIDAFVTTTHLTKSFMNENAVFMILTAMARNFYQFLLQNPVLEEEFGIKKTSHINKFIFRLLYYRAGKMGKNVQTACPQDFLREAVRQGVGSYIHLTY